METAYLRIFLIFIFVVFLFELIHVLIIVFASTPALCKAVIVFLTLNELLRYFDRLLYFGVGATPVCTALLPIINGHFDMLLIDVLLIRTLGDYEVIIPICTLPGNVH